MEHCLSAGLAQVKFQQLHTYFTYECLLYSLLALYCQKCRALVFSCVLLLPLVYEWAVLRDRLLRSLPMRECKKPLVTLLIYSLKAVCAIFVSLRLPGFVFQYFAMKMACNALMLALATIITGKSAGTLTLTAINSLVLLWVGIVTRLGEGTALALGEAAIFAWVQLASAIEQESTDAERQRTIREFLMGFPEAVVVLSGTGTVVLKNQEGFVLFGKTTEYHGGSFVKFAEKLQEMNHSGTTLQQNIDQFRKDVDATYQNKMQWAQDYYFDDEAVASSKSVMSGTPQSRTRCSINVTMAWMADPLYCPEDRGEIVLVFKDISERGALREQRLADDMKSMLISTMSHELRTPLNGIIGILNMICDKLPPGIRAWWNAAYISAQLLLNTVNCMLDFSQLEMHKFVPHVGVVNIRGMLSELTGLFEEIVTKDKVELTHRVDGGVPLQFRSDPSRVRQIVMNLLSNAANFTFTGTVTLCCSMAEADVMRIEVADTGVGISKEKQTNLFKLFGGATAESTTTAVKTAGLGLTVSNRLVQELGGSLSVQSTQNVGSTFSFTLKEFPVDSPRAAQTSASIGSGTDRLRFRNTSENEIKLRFDCKPEQRRSTMMRLLLKKSITLVGNEARLSPLQLGVTEEREIFSEAKKCEESDSESSGSESAAQDSDSANLEVGEEFDPAVDMQESVKAIHRSVNRLDFSFEVGTRKSKAMSADLSDIRRKKRRPCDVEVLVVDDSAINRLVLTGMLHNLGYFPKEACNGQQACDAVLQRESKFDIILMDVQMPLMDGIEATYRLRKIFGREELPIVGVTALNSEFELQKCIDAGMNDTLTKPLSLQDVRMLMNKYGLLYADPMSHMTL